MNLQLDEKTARKMYPIASPEYKAILEQSFGVSFFSQKITDRVQTFEDILSISGKTMSDLAKDGDTVDEIAYKQAKLIAVVYNEGTLLDPMNTSERKYYPWHEIAPCSGSGLAYDVYDYWSANSHVGVRLCFKSADLAVDAGKKFVDIYANLKIK